MSALSVSVVIPTYRRSQALLHTIECLSAQVSPRDELLIVDQTEQHDHATEARLRRFHAEREIVWIKQSQPSVTAAMNRGLKEAKGDIALFIDDDVRLEAGFLEAHREAHQTETRSVVAGRVLQPWEEDGDGSPVRQPSLFAGVQPRWVDEFMGGNFSIRRTYGLELGGFDENFVHVAYRFEAEFAHRLRADGGRIRFEPRACLHHLRISSGGTRSYGVHLRTARPSHAVGEYYFALRTSARGRRLRKFLSRPLQAITTRHHLRSPWWIPVTLCAEARGMWWALQLHRQGPRLITKERAKCAVSTAG